MNFEITIEGIICEEDCTDAQIEETFGTVMEALVDIGVQDPFVGGSVADRRIEITLVVDATSEGTAVERGTDLINRALTEVGLELRTEPKGTAALSWSSTSVRPAV